MDGRTVSIVLLIFMAGWFTGMLGSLWIVGYLVQKVSKFESSRRNKSDPADWWKDGGKPPSVYDDD